MQGHAASSGSLVVGVAAAFILAACGTAVTPTGSAMMGGGPDAANPTSGSGMMGGGSQYHYSRLTCSPPKSLPGHTVSVTLADMGLGQVTGGTAPLGVHMMLRAGPVTASAGVISLVARNMGWRTHELVILPLAAGAAAGQRITGRDGKVAETKSLGEASSSCAAGAGKGIPSRSIGWTTVKLPPGRYELLCNLPDHYADGMRQELVVT
jgi:uncharacterized cupredoxin-like copper-binding protein